MRSQGGQGAPMHLSKGCLAPSSAHSNVWLSCPVECHTLSCPRSDLTAFPLGWGLDLVLGHSAIEGFYKLPF